MMKDLYTRNSLKFYASLEGIPDSNLANEEQDRSAAKFILGHPGRKEVYDRTHATLHLIGGLRSSLQIQDTEFWKKGDFYKPFFVFNSERAQSAQQRGHVNPTAKAFSAKNSSAMWLPLLVFFSVCVLAVYVKYLEPTSSPKSPYAESRYVPERKAPSENTKNFTSMHVTATSLNVRRLPSADSDVIGKLTRLETVQAFSDSPATDWVKIFYNGEIGYVSTRFVDVGDGLSAKLAECRRSGIRRPESGEVFSRSRVGHHRLTVKASPLKDSIVKLKDEAGGTVLSMYIRAGRTESVNNIPEGRYRFMFSTGKNYSDSCAAFLDDVYAAQSGTFDAYVTTRSADGVYYSIMEYVLYDVSGGNFSPKKMNPEDF